MPSTIAIGWLEAGGQWRQRWETLTKEVSEALDIESREQFDPDSITKEVVAHAWRCLALVNKVFGFKQDAEDWRARWEALSEGVG